MQPSLLLHGTGAIVLPSHGAVTSGGSVTATASHPWWHVDGALSTSSNTTVCVCLVCSVARAGRHPLCLVDLWWICRIEVLVYTCPWGQCAKVNPLQLCLSWRLL
jgi:hypothetical protein